MEMLEYTERVGKVIYVSSQTHTLSNSDSELLNSECENDYEQLDIPNELNERLFLHQKAGVHWLHGLYQKDLGGILGI